MIVKTEFRFFGTDRYENDWILAVRASSEDEARQRISKSTYSDIEWELIPQSVGNGCDFILD